MQELLKDKNYIDVKNNDNIPDLRSNSAAKIPPSDLVDRNAKSIVLGGKRGMNPVSFFNERRLRKR